GAPAWPSASGRDSPSRRPCWAESPRIDGTTTAGLSDHRSLITGSASRRDGQAATDWRKQRPPTVWWGSRRVEGHWRKRILWSDQRPPIIPPPPRPPLIPPPLIPLMAPIIAA